jgi:hypothetical protein
MELLKENFFKFGMVTAEYGGEETFIESLKTKLGNQLILQLVGSQ